MKMVDYASMNGTVDQEVIDYIAENGGCSRLHSCSGLSSYLLR